MARLGRAQPFKPLIRQVRGTMSFSSVLTEGMIGIDTDTNQKIRPLSLTEGMIGIDSIVRSLLRSVTEGMIGVDTIARSLLRSITDGMIGVDSVLSVSTLLIILTENLIGIDTIRKTLNGATVIWSHIAHASAATWTKVTKATASWTHINRN